MAKIRPFRAVRPARDKEAQVTSRSYERYTKHELEATLTGNPMSFLHIIQPGFKLPEKVTGQHRFDLVREQYREFLDREILIRDEKPSFYVYRMIKENFSCLGFFCATSTEDYENNIIRKHEDTLLRRETLFASYLKVVRFNAEPVLMTYPDNMEIAGILQETSEDKPQCDFKSPDGVQHLLWVVDDPGKIRQLQEAAKEIKSLYIADGHHRSASSCRLARELSELNPEHKGNEAYNYFMSYLVPESEVRIYEFNRMVRGLNGHSAGAVLELLDEHFKVENKGTAVIKPGQKHQFSMYLQGNFYLLTLREDKYNFSDPLSSLDSHILKTLVLDPILGIRDLRNDKRIQYGYGKENTALMKQEVDKGNFSLGFGMLPITVDELKAVADAGLVMPPKSTYIEPKLRSGFTVYEL
ncbi:DUF1015 domain-containing protein [Zeaxanthinibacter enoshimensis]|uniref:Uncharacterized protein (DUF1015 family) n=1 Tax=Zeaxanthinibacter enoshimensis TaxID=392009 RepID=A0A4V3D3W9_9FLAO|nr:DUF1015 domain-containing protein [Zeaxanthinibacter enoshimensis]TDQ31613.1 uncharacterized protein (DUF1015 family) [Zeaxanthinibacter enoshimensis]